MKRDAQIVDIQALKKDFAQTGKTTSILDLQNIFNDFITKQKVERISRIRDVELDKICRMMYFGIRHTAILNILIAQKTKTKLDDKKKFNFSNLNYNEIEVSSILEYTMINLSLRLSLDSQSRLELKEIITSLVGIQLQKEIKQKEEIQNSR